MSRGPFLVIDGSARESMHVSETLPDNGLLFVLDVRNLPINGL
jgi:hypothetical protein